MKNEVATVAVIITRHSFDAIRTFHSSKGPLRIYEEIVECAEQFVMQYAHVENWEEYCKEVEVDDWEMFIINFAHEYFKI